MPGGHVRSSSLRPLIERLEGSYETFGLRAAKHRVRLVCTWHAESSLVEYRFVDAVGNFWVCDWSDMSS